MLSKLTAFVRKYDLISPGDRIVAAVSGGADSVALLFALHLLQDTVDFSLSAAHFNHHLRGKESDRDEAFVRQFCDRYDIPLYVGEGNVVPGPKGLEAAARDARYAFLRSLSGKIATAHTADDNAETVLLHLIRGTGLKGLGAIAPLSGNLIRPMLSVTRQDVEDFLEEYYLPHVEDSSNGEDAFLRNRIRHHVMPLLRQENPRIAENLSAMAQRLRLDESCIAEQAAGEMPDVPTLRQLHPAVRRRYLERFLRENGIREPEDSHIAQMETLVFSDNPSARMNFPGGAVISRCYDRLQRQDSADTIPEQILTCPGSLELPQLRVRCLPAAAGEAFTVKTAGRIVVRSRQPGDAIRLPGGTRTLKKLFIDRKIPAFQRGAVPVIADDYGVLGVYGIGVNLDRVSDEADAVTILFEKL